jgi:hypothetical protein
MSKRDMIFLNIGVGACSSIVTTFVVLFSLSLAGTSVSTPQPTGGTEGLLFSAQQTVQQAGLPGRPFATGQGSVVQICKSDTERFCAKRASDADQIACLQDHFDEVSEACHKQLQDRRDHFAPCKNDIARFCAQTGYGGGRMEKCLREAGAKLSQSCARLVKR